MWIRECTVGGGQKKQITTLENYTEEKHVQMDANMFRHHARQAFQFLMLKGVRIIVVHVSITEPLPHEPPL